MSRWGRAVVVVWALAGGATLAAGPAAPELPQGQRVYEQHCAICHAVPGAGFVVLSRRPGGIEPDLMKRGGVPESFVRHVVRHGMGLMPTFSKVQISDDELGAVATYLARPREAAR